GSQGTPGYSAEQSQNRQPATRDVGRVVCRRPPASESGSVRVSGGAVTDRSAPRGNGVPEMGGRGFSVADHDHCRQGGGRASNPPAAVFGATPLRIAAPE